MNIYMISRPHPKPLEYHFAVVFAEDEESAKKIHPADGRNFDDPGAWDGCGDWPSTPDEIEVEFVRSAINWESAESNLIAAYVIPPPRH